MTFCKVSSDIDAHADGVDRKDWILERTMALAAKGHGIQAAMHIATREYDEVPDIDARDDRIDWCDDIVDW